MTSSDARGSIVRHRVRPDDEHSNRHGSARFVSCAFIDLMKSPDFAASCLVSVRDALSRARKARRIELCSAGRGCAATEAEEHAREAQERLAAILEYGAFDGRRTNALNEPVPLMTPDELRFVHRALVSAQRELTAAFDCFGADERREAARFAARAAKGDLVSLGLDAQARQILDGQDRAIGDAIRGLGGPPPSLYADDLQRQNDALLAGSDGR